MKTILVWISTVFFVLLVSNSNAAMSCIDATTSSDSNVIVTCTFDTTPATAVADMPSSAMNKIKGDYVYTFKILPGSTGPTDNSDLQILDSDSVVILSASGNGANVIDNTSITSVIYGDGPTAGSTNHYPLADGKQWTITVTNNAVSNSSFSLIMQTVE